MTYRRDSDIVIRELHGKVVPKKSTPNNKIEQHNCIRKLNYERRKSKTKLIAWFVSRCQTSSIQREEYVVKLKQYVQVDIYGTCGNLSCNQKGSSNCYEMLRSDCKFYLALENSYCPDYVTEKFFRPLLYETVPIVMGGADYDLFAPPNSFIHVNNFRSPKELAEYLILLDKSDDLYDQYFSWRNDFNIDLNPMDGWCDLCKLAHDPQPKTKIYHDINKWWIDEQKCQNKTFNLYP